MSLNINGGSTSTYMQGWDAFKNPKVTTTQYTTTTGGTTTTSTIKDSSVTATSTLNAYVNNTVYCNYTINNFNNNTPSICNTSAFPNVVSLASGTGQIILNTDYGSLLAMTTSKMLHVQKFTKHLRLKIFLTLRTHNVWV